MSERFAVRFLPRVQLYRRPQPAHPPFYVDYMSDALKKQGYGGNVQRAARHVNILWNLLEDKDDFLSTDGVPGMPQHIRASAMTLNYNIAWTPTTKSHWIYQPSEEETAWRALDRAEFESKKSTLQTTIAEKLAKNQDVNEEQATLKDVESILEQLRDGGHGYFRTAYEAMGTGVSGLFWGLAAPNVPVVVTSAFTLSRDRAISFRLKRLLAPGGDSDLAPQAEHGFDIELGDRNTLYAIRFGDGGKNAEFIHYRPVNKRGRPSSIKDRESLRAAREEFLDFGRLTPADLTLILGWTTEEQAIRGAAKASGDKLTPEQSARIKALNKLASDLRESKHRTPAQSENLKDIEDLLYLDRMPLQVQEAANELIGEELDITVQFLRAGYIVIRINDASFVYGNKRITSLKPPRYANALPEKSFITLRSDGGKWGIVLGHPRYDESGSVWSQPFEIPFAFGDGEPVFALDGDWDADSCEATLELYQLRAPTFGATPQPGSYQLRLDMSSANGRYTPEIYRIACHIPAGAIPDYGAAEWNSEDAANRGAGNASRIKDVLLQDDKRRSLGATVIVANSQDSANLPPGCGGLGCDLTLYDRTNASNIVTLKQGMVVEDRRALIGTIETSSGFASVALTGDEAKLEVVGVENFLNKRISAPVPGDGMFPNDYIRLLCHDGGLHNSLFAQIDAGDIGWARIPPTSPGRFPKEKPGAATTYLEIIRGVVKNHCPGADFWSDGTGLRLEKFGARNRTDLNFGAPPSVPASSPLCLRGEFKLAQDLRDFHSSATITGAINPLTGERFSATESIPQMTDDRFQNSVFYTGIERPYEAQEDSLTDEAACRRASREVLNITPLTPDGLAPRPGAIEIDYDPTLRAGDLIRIFGIKFIADSNEFSALGSAQRSKLSVQLAEDKTLPEVSP